MPENYFNHLKHARRMCFDAQFKHAAIFVLAHSPKNIIALLNSIHSKHLWNGWKIKESQKWTLLSLFLFCYGTVSSGRNLGIVTHNFSSQKREARRILNVQNGDSELCVYLFIFFLGIFYIQIDSKMFWLVFLCFRKELLNDWLNSIEIIDANIHELQNKIKTLRRKRKSISRISFQPPEKWLLPMNSDFFFLRCIFKRLKLTKMMTLIDT